MIYLDFAATTPLLPEVKEALRCAIDAPYGNASALHTPGHTAKVAIEAARESLAALIHADPSEIIFTSGSTESNNTIINSFRDQIIATSTIEHKSIIEAARTLASEYIPLEVDKFGEVCYNENIWLKTPALISITLASNELGTIEPLEFWSKKAHQHGALVHSDMTQALGKIPIDVKKLGVDYATFSAHKIGGPIGVGALYIKKGSPFTPLMIGGSQERHRRSGTYNTLGIIGFKAAIDYLKSHDTPTLYHDKVAPLRDYLAKRITDEIPGSVINGIFLDNKKLTPEKTKLGPLCEYRKAPGAAQGGPKRSLLCAKASIQKNTFIALPHILNVSFPGAEGESIQLHLDLKGIIVSTGSACAAGEPSHVLTATTGDPELAHSSIRFSLDPSTTRADIDYTMSVLPDIIKKLRGISTQ